MSNIKHWLGLDNCNITDYEIMRRFTDAKKKDLDEVDFETKDGAIIRVFLPHLKFDEYMYKGG